MYRNNSFNHNYNRTVSHSPKKNNYCQKILISNYFKANNKIPSSLNSSLNSNKEEQNEILKIKNKYKELLRENEQLKIINSIKKRSGSGIKKIVNTQSLIKNLSQGNIKKNFINSINSSINNSKKGKSLNNKNNTIDNQYNNFMKKDFEISGTLSNINLELNSSFNINNNISNQNIINNNLNTINNNNINLAHLVLNFLKQMKDLQENISKKQIIYRK